MIDKTSSIEEAISRVSDGDTIMVGGFGVPGTPFCLIDELLCQGQKNLTLIKNDANETAMGVDKLLEAGQVSRLITSHIGLNPRAIKSMNDGSLVVELCSQGILAERIRAAGAGLSGILTDIGLGTQFSEHKTIIEFEGQRSIIEAALKADFAFVHAARADSFGNLIYQASAQNFNPLMAQAAAQVIAEVETISALGELPADTIHTPGPFVDCVVSIPELTKEYGIVQR